MPLKNIETISVFCKKSPTYNPQGLIKVNKIIKNPVGKTRKGQHISGQNGGAFTKTEYVQEFGNYPRQLLRYSHEAKPIHNTQKPVPLLEYLIKTYTNPGEVVLDNCMGSGSTGVACVNTGRRFIGMELDQGYFDISVKRIAEAEKAVIVCG